MRGEIDDLPDPFFDSCFQSQVAQAEQALRRQRRRQRRDGPSLRGYGGPASESGADVGEIFCAPRDSSAARSVLIDTSKAGARMRCSRPTCYVYGGADPPVPHGSQVRVGRGYSVQPTDCVFLLCLECPWPTGHPDLLVRPYVLKHSQNTVRCITLVLLVLGSSGTDGSAPPVDVRE